MKVMAAMAAYREIGKLIHNDYDMNKTYKNALNTARDALYKQVPRRPIKNDGNDEFVYVSRCPNCCSILSQLDCYCSDCGQRIDWSEEE